MNLPDSIVDDSVSSRKRLLAYQYHLKKVLETDQRFWLQPAGIQGLVNLLAF